LIEYSSEKAGVGGSTPSLATMFSLVCGYFINLHINAVLRAGCTREIGTFFAQSPSYILFAVAPDTGMGADFSRSAFAGAPVSYRRNQLHCMSQAGFRGHAEVSRLPR
jgi:hypothetical protein